MLFQNLGQTVVSDMFKQAMLTLNAERKNEARRRLDFYHDGQLAYLQVELEKRFLHPEKLRPVFVNIVKKVINRLAQVYWQIPKREIQGADRDRTIYAEISRSSGLDMKLKMASRYVKLLKTVVLRPVWRNGKMDLDILTPDILDVQMGLSPEDLVSVAVTHYGVSERIEDVTFSVWTPETWRKLNYQGREIESGTNPYGVVPFVPLWDRTPIGGEFWLDGGDDIMSLQEAVNERLVDLLHVIRFQAFGVGFIKGRGGESIDSIDPGSLVELPENGELGYAATEAQISETVEAIDKLVKWAAISNGLPASSLSTEPTEESGISKMVSNFELLEMRRDDVALFRTYEQRLFYVMRAVWNAHNAGRTMSNSATLLTDFFDPSPQISPKEQAETFDRLLEMGVISPVDVVMERNPDIATREDAMAFLLKLQDETRQLNERTI